MLEADGPHGRSSSLFSLPDFLISARPLVSGCVLLAPVTHDIQFFTHTGYIDHKHKQICAHWDQLSHLLSRSYFYLYYFHSVSHQYINLLYEYQRPCFSRHMQCSSRELFWISFSLIPDRFFQQWVHYWMVFPGFLWQMKTFWTALGQTTMRCVSNWWSAFAAGPYYFLCLAFV